MDAYLKVVMKIENYLYTKIGMYATFQTIPCVHVCTYENFKNFPNYFENLGSHKNARHSANIGYFSV